MLETTTTPTGIRLGNYSIASGDMYYSELGQREIFVSDNPHDGFHVWGEIPGIGPASSISLCEIFLEYSSYCRSSHDKNLAYAEMKSFAENLGKMLTGHLKKTSSVSTAKDPGVCAMECIFESLQANVTVERIGPDLRFVLAGCPFLDTADKTGMKDIDFARFGFNTMIQNIINTIDPYLTLHTPLTGEATQAYTIHKPILSHFEPEEMTIIPRPHIQLKEKNESIDAFTPAAMANRAIETGVIKAELDSFSTFMLAVLAGAFIAMGAIFATTVTAGGAGLPYGVVKLLSGLAFSLGLVMVIVAGSELFTGNNLIIMAFMNGKISWRELLRNWSIVYIGNFIGAFLTAVLIILSKQFTYGNGAVGQTMLGIAEAKTSLGFVQAVALGICCNALVCIAVWMCFSARSTVDKILAIIPPIAAFVAAGFEHSIANMYFISAGMLVKYSAPSAFFETIQKTPNDFPNLTMGNFIFANLLPVTLGNIIGGAIMVGIVYWSIYLRKSHSHLQDQVARQFGGD